MKKYLSIIKSDLQNIQRDPTLLLLFWVPLLVWAMCFFGVPALNGLYPVISPYYYPIVIFFALLVAIFPGFILSFILLDEKDTQLLPVIKVTPVSLSGFLLTRLIFIGCLSFLFSLLFLLFNGLVPVSVGQAGVIAFLSALNMPILTLLISTVAKNKVEGMTYLKVANVTLFLPALVFFIHSPWEYGFGALPAFWVFQTAHLWPNITLMISNAGMGILVLLFYNYAAFKFSLKRLTGF